jgi:hypothetical protein
MRDEIGLFVQHAAEAPEAFRTRDGAPVDALDLALVLKLLPRTGGARLSDLDAALALLGWATTGRPEDGADLAGEAPPADVRFPRTAARLRRMLRDVETEGVVSFWR